MFADESELISALGSLAESNEIEEIRRLSAMGLPPGTSPGALAVMFGINPGLIWSLEHNTHRHYRRFSIPKGKGVRQIDAPRVALKTIQKWLSVHLQKKFQAPDHVFGFVPGRSHIKAAAIHCGARWIYSVDIENFFPSTPIGTVADAFRRIGYESDSAKFLARLCCLRGFLAQGAPTSPVVSNMVFSQLDQTLAEIASRHDVKISRYADDIVFSGAVEFPRGLIESVNSSVANTPWKLSERKTELSKLPQRLKVHGLLVHGETVRLTKGYRKRIRAFQHLLSKGRIQPDDVRKIIGHLKYSNQVLTEAEHLKSRQP